MLYPMGIPECRFELGLNPCRNKILAPTSADGDGRQRNGIDSSVIIVDCG